MNLYEIKYEMYSLIDPETGEILDYDAFEELALNRDEKLDSTASWIKSLEAEAEAVDNEAKRLIERRNTIRRKAERLREYLQYALDDHPWKNEHHDIRYRKSTAVEITDENRAIAWLMDHNEDALTYQQPKISKTAVKEIIRSGQEVPGAELVERLSMQLK